MARLIHKEVQEINNDVQLCPICRMQITQHIITQNWNEMSVCSCGWNSSQKLRIGPHQSRFYKMVPTPEKEECLALVETVTFR